MTTDELIRKAKDDNLEMIEVMLGNMESLRSSARNLESYAEGQILNLLKAKEELKKSEYADTKTA